MIEVFKTNVTDPFDAIALVELIQSNFNGYKANFDLEDCDKILRVKSIAGPVNNDLLINLLNQREFFAEVLADEIPAIMQSI